MINFNRLPSYEKILLLASAAILLVLLEAFTYAFMQNKYEEQKSNYILTLSNEWERGYQSITHHFKMVTDTVIFALNNDGKLKSILEQANHTGDLEAAHSRLLGDYTELDLVNQANSSIKIFQVHDKKGNVLIRFQKLDRYGDNVLTYLGVIISTHKNKTLTHGFEGGKYFNAYRFAYPIMKDGEFLGSVQLGFEERAINEHMQDDFMVSSYFAVDINKNKVASEETVASSLSIPSRKFVHHDKSYPKEKQQLIDSLFKGKEDELAKVIGGSDKLIFSSEIDGKHYAVAVEPFVDFSGEESGYMVFFKDDKNLIFMQKDYFISLTFGLALAFFLWVLLVLAFAHYYKTSTKLAKEIQRRQEQERLLLQQSKMAMMGEMIGVIAHQWRQPLNTISIMVYELSSDFEDNRLNAEGMEEFKDSVTTIIRKMSDTIDDFRNFFKPRKTKVEFFIESAVSTTLKIMLPQLNRHYIECLFDERGQSPVCSYKNELEQAIMILVSNAKDALVSNKIKKPRIQISVKETGNGKVSVSIHDNAGGVPDEIKDRIFEPYFTTKSDAEGTGIGLYMAKEIVERVMNGRLYFENIDNGACFIIEIPKQISDNTQN